MGKGTQPVNDQTVLERFKPYWEGTADSADRQAWLLNYVRRYSDDHGVPPPVSTVQKAIILEFIRGYVRDKSLPPGVREIAVGTGFSQLSFGWVSQYITQLVAEGWLETLGQEDSARRRPYHYRLANPPPAAYYGGK